MSLKLIVESNFNNYDVQYDYLIEADEKSGARKYFIEGPFVQTEIANRNRRVYGRQLMEQCVRDYISDRLDPRKGIRSYGELGHPEGVEINPDRISHYTTKLDWVGNDCMGKAEILDTPMGKIVQTILEKGLRLATSTRGLGALNDNPNHDGSRNVDSYEMIASDIVIDPSAPQGYVEGILENKEYIVQGNDKGQKVFVECFDRMESQLSDLPRHSGLRHDTFDVALKNFLSGI